MIVVKREVAERMQIRAGFPWSECQVIETGDKSLYESQLIICVRSRAAYETTCRSVCDTHGRVYSHRLSY